MSATTPCLPCCSTPQSVDIPGPEGIAGLDGQNGQNAYTTTTAPFTTPGFLANVTVSVVNSGWMVVGQTVIIGALGNGPATFIVQSLPNATSAVLKYQDYAGDIGSAQVINAGARVAPAARFGGFQSPFSFYAAGAVYSLTTTPAVISIGGNPTQVALTQAGTYLLFGAARFDFNAATFAAVRTVSMKLRQTAGAPSTPGDVANATAAFKTPLSAPALTYTGGILTVPVVQYITGLTTDIIQMFASINVLPGAGTVDAVEAWITALLIQ